MNILKACGDWIGRKVLWLTALAIFWSVWFGLPSFVLTMFDLNLVLLRGFAKLVSWLPYLSVADHVGMLLDNWVKIVKNATWFIRFFGGDRVELALRTMAFEGIILWWQFRLALRLLVRVVDLVLFKLDLTGIREVKHPVRPDNIRI